MRLSGLLTFASLALQGCNALAFQGRPYDLFKIDDRDLLQDVVTFDEKSLFINGERLMIFSGEVHPFRLPVPSLWLDIFQKVKALGLNTVSFYVHWGALEGKQGNFTAEGVFAYEPFFAAAKEAGIYLLARPGPYISLWYRNLPNCVVQSADSLRRCRGDRRWLPRLAAAHTGQAEDISSGLSGSHGQVCAVLTAGARASGLPCSHFSS